MVDLLAKTAFEGLLPITAGGLTLSEVSDAVVTSLAPYHGQKKALSEALKVAHGMALPPLNRATGREGGRALWFGHGQYVMIGDIPEASLANFAAVTDQSDAWGMVRLEGENAEQVLARLVPLDLRKLTFKRGHTARSQLQHMSVSVTRVSDKAFLVLGFRSMAQTLVHDLQTAMKGVAARGAS